MKPFSWSWSRYKNYRTCPKRHYHVDIKKDYFEAPSEALDWGNEVHKAMAARIANGIPLPPTMKRFEWWPSKIAALKAQGVDVRVEQKIAIDRQLQPTNFFDQGTWFRAVADVLALLPKFKAAITVDWKTGKVQPEFEQLALSSQTIFAHHPEIDEVGSIYVWIGSDTQTIETYRRDGMAPTWNKVWPQVQKMEEAWKTTEYPPTPSGICINWCPVTGCPFHGKGSPR